MKAGIYFCFAYLAIGGGWSAPVEHNTGCSARTSSGMIIGHQAPDRPQVDEYLGIRYAKAPVGPLRFAKPEPYCSNETYVASNFSAECPAVKGKNGTLPGQPYTPQENRIIGYFIEQFPTHQAEDCLALNIWSKRSPNDKKPVLIWIYGGQYETGTTNTPFYHGQYIADAEDIIVVTFNYRFTIFGFPGASPETQNVGLYDVRAATEWVRDNIASFGGDPAQIILAGHSAGAFQADYYAYKWLDDPIIKGMILQSGTVKTLPQNAPEYTAAAFANVSTALGCGPDEQVECMRTKPWQAILNATAHAIPRSPLALPFAPTVDNAIVFNGSEYNARLHAGQLIRVPTLLGNADYEAGFYKVTLAAKGAAHLNETAWTLLGKRLATCPAAQAAAQRARLDMPTWRYRYFGAFANLELYPDSADGTVRGSGAYHGAELSVLFGTTSQLTGLRNAGGEDAMSAYMMRAWAAFARDPAHGLAREMAWPQYSDGGADAGEKTLVRLAVGNEAGATFGPGDEYDDGCAGILAGSAAQGM